MSRLAVTVLISDPRFLPHLLKLLMHLRSPHRRAEQAETLRNVRELLHKEGPAVSADLTAAIRSADSAEIVQKCVPSLMPLPISRANTLYPVSIAAKKPGWTATSVMRVYIEAASQAHERLNVLTEIMFLDALKKAQSLDAEFERTGKVTGPCEAPAGSPWPAIPSSAFCAAIRHSRRLV